MTRNLTLVLLFALVMSVACFGGDDGEPTLTTTVAAVATSTPIQELTPSPTTAPSTATPEPSPPPLSAVWLYDIESGQRQTLFEDAERRTVPVTRFEGDAVTVRDRSASLGSPVRPRRQRRA